MTAGWTDDRVGALKKLWLEGQSASQIAKQLGGGVTRNAVIGKVHRLGLSGRAAPSQPARTATSFRTTRPRPAAPAATPAQAPQASAPRRLEAVSSKPVPPTPP
ncbi:MAG: GcrA family cell cycle regulator, partial [Phenylobacterium sp.]|nr:GcrA family cell cycle regulator [Phenylobacterium sp.]